MIPRGLRNNNPFNIRLNIHNKWLGAIPGEDPLFVTFESLDYGIRAWCVLIKNYVKRHHCSTICSIVNRFAPPSENNTLQYIRFVNKYVGNCRVDPSSPDFLFRLGYAMWIVENGVEPNHSVLLSGINFYFKTVTI